MRESASKEVSNDDLIAETGIDRSNISKILSSLEKEKKIQRRYEQVGRAKFVWVSLTNSHQNEITNSRDKLTNSHSKNEITNSRDKLTNSHSKNESFIDKDVVKEILDNDLTNSHQNEITNSQNTSAPGIKNFLVPEDIKIVWNDLKPSIASVFRKRKWPSKYASFQIFNNWMKSLLEA